MTRNIKPMQLSKIEEIISNIYKYEMKSCFLNDLNQSRKIFDFNKEILGEILINKYHRSDYEYKFTIISDHVASKQVIQLIGSKALAIHLFTQSETDEIPEFILY